MLEDAIHEINNHNASGLSFEELYRSPLLFAGDVRMLYLSSRLRTCSVPAWC